MPVRSHIGPSALPAARSNDCEDALVAQPSGYSVPVESTQAADWVRGSLASGSDLALQILPRLHLFGHAHLLVPPDADYATSATGLSDHGRGRPPSESDAAAVDFLRTWSTATRGTLVVEDDLARRGDPNLEDDDIVYINDRVLRWVDLRAMTPARAVALLRSGASGFPLNAYLCVGSSEVLGLSAKRNLSVADRTVLARAVAGLITTVYDAEAFLALHQPPAAMVLDR